MKEKAAEREVHQNEKQAAAGIERASEQQAIRDRGGRRGRHRDRDDRDVDVATAPHRRDDRDQQRLKREQDRRRKHYAHRHRYFTPPPMPRENNLKDASVPTAITTPFGRSRSAPSGRSTQPPRTRLGRRRSRMRSRPPSPSYDRIRTSRWRSPGSLNRSPIRLPENPQSTL